MGKALAKLEGLLDGGRDFREREAAIRLHAELKARAKAPARRPPRPRRRER